MQLHAEIITASFAKLKKPEENTPKDELELLRF
jgi:hypothetical protein